MNIVLIHSILLVFSSRQEVLEIFEEVCLDEKKAMIAPEAKIDPRIKFLISIIRIF